MKNMDNFCYEKMPSRATTKSIPFAVNKGEWNTKEDTSKMYCMYCNMPKAPHVGSAMKKSIITKLLPYILFQTVGHIKVFFYVPIKLVYLSLYDGNRDWFVQKIEKNLALALWSLGSFLYLACIVQVYTWSLPTAEINWFATVDMVWCCSAKNRPKITYFWIHSIQQSAKAFPTNLHYTVM